MADSLRFQRNYSRQFPTVKDRTGRQLKARKILSILTEYLGRKNLEGLTCLDMGCSVGVISEVIACAGAQVVGLDIDLEAMTQGRRENAMASRFVFGDVGAAPFEDETFDLIICAQVYEHTPSVELVAREIDRLLKSDGVCFFSGPNRWAVWEEHYHLPFLSWLPRTWADRFVRLAGRGTEYYERPRSMWGLCRVFRRFSILDLTPNLLTHPERYEMEQEVGAFKYVARYFPRWLWSFAGAFIPNFNWLLVKTEG